MPNRSNRAALAAGLSLSLGLSLCLAAPVAAHGAGDGMAGALGARVAYAAQDASGVAMSGMETSSLGGGAFDAATVIGLGGRTLYADVTVNGQKANKDPLTYTFDNASDAAGVVQLKADTGYIASHSGGVALDFYTKDGDAKSPVYSANVYAVCMTVDGQPVGGVADSMVAIRTAPSGQETSPIAAPRLVSRDGATYRLKGGASKAAPVPRDGVLYVDYERASATGTAASVAYVDEVGNVLDSEPLGTVEPGKPQTYTVRDKIEANGYYWRPIIGSAGTVTVSAEQPDATVRCARGASTEKRDVKVVYVAEDGRRLMADSVSVGAAGYNYAPARVFSQAGESGVLQYELTGAVDDAGRTYSADEAASLALSYGGASTYTLTYRTQKNELTYAVNLALVAPDGNGNISVSVTDSKSATFSEDAGASIELPSTIQKDGYTYTLQGPSSYSYAWGDLGTGRLNADTAYYVRSDVKAPAAYDVTVRYVDAVTGNVLGTSTQSCDPAGEPLSITGPETVDADGVTYARLSGQEAAISHGYYAPYRTYTIYYAVPGALAQGNTTVHRTVVTDGGVTYYTVDGTDGGVTVNRGATGGNGGLAATAPYTTLTGGNADGGNGAGGAGGTSVGSADQGEPLAPNGNTADEERIDDDQTPLAGAEASRGLPVWAYGVGAAVLAAVVALLALLARKRRTSENEEA